MKHLIAQKHFLFNKWKRSPDSETYSEFKRIRNLVNRRLREAHNNFCINFFQKLPTSKEQWKFIKQKTSPSERVVKVDEIRLDSGEISREPKNIVNCLPTKMKLAYVTPIFKKGDKLDSTNYRPISVTPSFAKIFERLF